jgi:hypothetical protein
MPSFTLVVTEGILDATVGERLLDQLGIERMYTRFVPKGGADVFWRECPRYNQAAKYVGPVLGLADLEQAPCASGLITDHLPAGREPGFVVRIAERMVESWLLADRARLSEYLRVSPTRISANPETYPHPKRALVDVARHSARRDVREDIVPEQGSMGIVGRGYTARITEFIRQYWNPLDARENSPSLARAITAIKAAAK